MNQNEDISNELSELDLNIPLHIPLPYVVPAMYFEDLGREVMETIHVNEFISSLPADTDFEVPGGYFESLADSVSDRIQTGDFLSGLTKEMPYQVPDGYFNTLGDQVITKRSRVIKLTPLRHSRSLVSRFAVAASLVIILISGFFLMRDKNQLTLEQELAMIPDSEINAYIALHQQEFDEMVTYHAIDESSLDYQDLENDIYSSYIETIPEEELKDFL